VASRTGDACPPSPAQDADRGTLRPLKRTAGDHWGSDAMATGACSARQMACAVALGWRVSSSAFGLYIE
jgi:hypothetical protein